MPPTSSKHSPASQNNRSISSFFNPVKKPIENDNRPMIKVNANLKSINRPMFASKSSAFSLSKSSSGNSSTDNLAETFGKVGFESKLNKPLFDLTTSTKRLKQQSKVMNIDNDSEDENEEGHLNEIRDENSDDDDVIMVGSKRVLRERKPMKKMNRIVFSSDEEAEQDDDEVADDGSIDEVSTSSDKFANSKKRRQPVSDSEDDLMEDDVDEPYVENQSKAINLHEITEEKDKIERITRIVHNATIDEIRTALREKGSVVAACQELMYKGSTHIPIKKPRLTNRHYKQQQNAIEISEDDDEDNEESEDDDDDDDDSNDDDVDDGEEERWEAAKIQKQTAVIRYFNTCSSKDLQVMSGCKATSADKLIELRPFADEDDLEIKLKQTKGLSVKYIDNCYEMMSGYRAVDQIIKKIENLGYKLRNILDIWEELSVNSRQSSPTSQQDDDQPGMNLTNIDIKKKSMPRYQDALNGYLIEQPKCVNPTMTLKDYQMLGVNWMLLLYRKGISGILADEMGLGKTAQVISFLGRLNEIGEDGPHLIIVPSSTIQNWEREFERFCPGLDIRIYHGSQQERMEQRMNLLYENQSNAFQVIITTYNLASGHVDDRKFFKKLGCHSMILDEGHMVKNCTSARYKSLMSIKTPFRLLLTGTPLQNNLQELVSLLTFIMPETFVNHEEDIRSIFKIRKSTSNDNKDNASKADDTSIQVLAKERINRAKKMMTPFVLRRKKENVLGDLPKKEQIIQHCDMTENQSKVYSLIIEQTKKKYQESLILKEEAKELQNTKKEDKEKYQELQSLKEGAMEKIVEKKTAMAAQFEDMSNVVIHLRKAADHPLLFRNIYTDDLLREMAKELHKDVKYWDSNLEYMYEDMTIMSDFELDRFCREEKVC